MAGEERDFYLKAVLSCLSKVHNKIFYVSYVSLCEVLKFFKTYT